MDGAEMFAAVYEVETQPEFPGNGDWGCPVYGYAAEGSVAADFESRWGAPTVLRVISASGAESILMFGAGGLGGASAVSACPNPDHLCVVVAGLAYLVDTDEPERGAVIIRSDTQEIVPLPDESLLLLPGFQDIAAVGVNGVAWRSPRLVLDRLAVDHGHAGRIFGHGEGMSGWVDFEIDAATGQPIRSC
jgi:hypothetical protein